MSYEESTEYEYADEEQTIVRIIRQEYFDIAQAEIEVAAIDADLAVLPEPRDPPTEEEFNRNMSDCGYSYESYVEMVYHRHNMNPELQRRSLLEHERKKLVERTAFYRDKAEQRG